MLDKSSPSGESYSLSLPTPCFHRTPANSWFQVAHLIPHKSMLGFRQSSAGWGQGWKAVPTMLPRSESQSPEGNAEPGPLTMIQPQFFRRLLPKPHPDLGLGILVAAKTLFLRVHMS